MNRETSETKNTRTCIVTRESGSPEEMIRFVSGPDGSVVPDLKCNLPGRGCWIKAERRYIDEAVDRKLFERALKEKVIIPSDLSVLIDRVLTQWALGSLALARKSGGAIAGSTKVEAAIRSGRVALLLHALEAAPDGIRKLTQACTAVTATRKNDIIILSIFTKDELALVFGRKNVIHVAVFEGNAATGFIKRVCLLDKFRGKSIIN